MADISQIDHPARRAVTVSIPPYLRDHGFEGNAVLPAVEALQLAADAVKKTFPQIDIYTQNQAVFQKFLYMMPGDTCIPAEIDMVPQGDGSVVARLITRGRVGTTSIIRAKEHAVVRFGITPGARSDCRRPIPDVSADSFAVDPERVYAHLVPFGPAYHSIVDTLHLTRGGGATRVAAVEHDGREALPGLLGSSFPLDAAFHAACVWAQRFEGMVAFPVGFERRVIWSPACPGEQYLCQVNPTGRTADAVSFDLFLDDLAGQRVEAVYGVSMRDVSRGRMQPPDWIVYRGAST
jgi:hypothetical protein